MALFYLCTLYPSAFLKLRISITTNRLIWKRFCNPSNNYTVIIDTALMNDTFASPTLNPISMYEKRHLIGLFNENLILISLPTCTDCF